MKVKLRQVLCDCVEQGIDYGYMRAHKHTDNPTEYSLKEEIDTAIMNTIHEYFIFEREWDE